MKRLVIAAAATAMMALPVAQAYAAPQSSFQLPVERVDHKRSHVDDRKGGRDDRGRHVRPKKAEQPRWQRGKRYSDWRRHRPVQDWHRHGLRKPARGQQWIRVGNDYLLVGVMSGLIAGIVAGR